MPLTRNSLLLGLVLAVLAGFAIGLVIGGRSTPTDPALPTSVSDGTPGASEPDATDAELLRALEALSADLRALTRHLASGAEGTPPVDSPGRTPAIDTDAIGGELEPALRELIELLRRRSGPGGSAVPPLRIPPAAPRQGVLGNLPDEGDDGEQLSRMHHFWTYQDVLDAYGRPTRIHPTNSGARWLYEDKENERTLVFTFADGMVVTVYD